jgi:hypothetical protein
MNPNDQLPPGCCGYVEPKAVAPAQLAAIDQPASPVKKWLSAWYDRQTSLIQALIVILLTTVLNQLPERLFTDLRPAAPILVPDQQQKVERGEKAAEVIEEIFGTVDPIK